MRVLHYIPSLAKGAGQAAVFAQSLHAELAKTVETRMYCGPIGWREWKAVVREFRPDVVHLHGSWDWHLALARCIANRCDVPVVVSPHGGLSPVTLQKDFWKSRLPRMLAYQLCLVRRAMVLHAATQQELADLKQLGWKRRIALITGGDDDASRAAMAEDFRRLYQKVIDTWQRGRLTDTQRQALWTLLNEELEARNEECVQTEVTNTSLLDRLTAHDWQTLQVYAIDHGISGLLLDGAKRVQAKIPETVKSVPARFSIKPVLRLATPSRAEKKVAGDTAEARLATDIVRLQRMLEHHETDGHTAAPIALFVAIYRQIRFGDYEEDRFNALIDKVGLRKFTARIMQLLATTFALPLGFMPLDPVNDKGAKALFKSLCAIEPITAQ